MEGPSSNKRTERIFNSLEGLNKAEMPAFFYTRLIGRMQNQLPEKQGSLLLRPVFLAISLSVVLLLNMVALQQINNKPAASKPQQTNEPATIQSFARAYNLNTESVYE